MDSAVSAAVVPASHQTENWVCHRRCGYLAGSTLVRLPVLSVLHYRCRYHAWLAGVSFAKWFLLLALSYRGPMLSFLTLALLMTGPLVMATLRLQLRDPFQALYAPKRASADLLSLVIPGGHWRFAQLTEPNLSRLQANINESSVHLGISVLILISVCVDQAPGCERAEPGSLVSSVFLLCCHELGPRASDLGQQILPALKLPFYLVFHTAVSSSAGLPCARAYDGDGCI